MIFFPGLDDVHHARHFERVFVSISRLINRVGDFPAPEWILDPESFSTLKLRGCHRLSVLDLASRINRWARCGKLLAAVAQDYMCERAIIEGCPCEARRKGLPPCNPEACFYGTRLSVAEHQRLTIDRYAKLKPLCPGVHVMPVLQGYDPAEYVSHLRDYGSLLERGMWVGVGSVCKRNANVGAIEDVLLAIKRKRPDLRLHGFGLKTTALASASIYDLLYSADSMAWSYAARRQGRNAHDWREAARFVRRIETQALQTSWNLH